MKTSASTTLVRYAVLGLCLTLSHTLWAENIAGGNDDDIVTGAIPEQQVPEFDAQKGKPPELGHCYHFKKMNFFAASWIERDLQDAKWSNPVTLPVTGEKVSREEWIEIDTCARTMMSEIGTEPACDGGENYDVALARIMYNRSKYMRTHPNRNQDPISAVLFPMKAAMEDKYQFSVWNAGAKVVDGAPCPSTTGANAFRWSQFVSLCKISVLNDGRIIKIRSPEMTDDMLYYTSGCKMHYQRLCQGYTPIRAKVDSTVVSNYKCFEMWKDNHVQLTDKQDSECMKQAVACCTPPSKGDRVIPEKKGDCDTHATSWSKNVTTPKPIPASSKTIPIKLNAPATKSVPAKKSSI